MPAQNRGLSRVGGGDREHYFSCSLRSQTLPPTPVCFVLTSLTFSFMSVNRETVNSTALTGSLCQALRLIGEIQLLSHYLFSPKCMNEQQGIVEETCFGLCVGVRRLLVT